MADMPSLRPRIGPIGVALTLYDVWRRLPPKQRQQAFELARKHGPTVAKQVSKLRAARKR
jgi:hypothetical protein